MRSAEACVATVVAFLVLTGCSTSSEHGPATGDGGDSGPSPSGGAGSSGATSSAGGRGAGGSAPDGSGGRSASGGAAAGSSGGATSASGGATSASGGESGFNDGGGAAPARPSPRKAACPAGAEVGTALPAARAATPLENGFGFIEGPVFIAEQSTLLFSDMTFGGPAPSGPPSRIRRMTLSGGTPSFDVFVEQSGSNGLALANDGRVLAATHDVQSLSYFDPVNGTRENWPLLSGTKHFNSPNDLVVRSDGNVYFTDPDYQLGSRSSQTGVRGVYRVSPGGNVTLVDGGFDQPNGITLSPDESTLYVGGASGGIKRFDLGADGTVGKKSDFAPGATDGMTVDCAGNVYTTNGDVVVFTKTGDELGRITVGKTPSNVAFGGPARKTLYITAQDTLFSIDLGIAGMPY